MSEERPAYELLGSGEAKICGTCRVPTPLKGLNHAAYCPVVKHYVLLGQDATPCQRYKRKERGND